MALGFEHSVANMFDIPGAMMLGAPISVGQWLIWNEIPVTIGNIIGGMIFTGLALYVTYKPAKSAATPAGLAVAAE